MSNTIIKVDNLGKSYLIGHERQQRYVALRDVVAKNTKGFLKGIQNAISGKQLTGGQEIEEFWALKDISFEIKAGEAVGIIGRNGAGKSTLLKLLSRITEPTKGRIELNGRVASLLEVGTGFHPELSGRENIFLNGAILGMSRAEIKSKFDEIVDFSGVEKFLDTPVKRYSSGMYVRLAFAVAAHLEPEILVVDEVLAVGDAEFQKKCLGKMDDVAKKEGRTILFVSHNLGAVQQLCSKSILLNKGNLELIGDTATVINAYLDQSVNTAADFHSYGSKELELVDFSLLNNLDKKSSELQIGYGGTLQLKIKANASIKNFEIAVNIKNLYGELVGHITSLDSNIILTAQQDLFYNIKLSIASINFTPGNYKMDIFLLKNDIFHANIDCINFTVLNSDKIKRPFGFPAHVKFFTETSWESQNVPV